MKRPPKPFARETRKLKPSTRPPETRIKAVRADAPPAPKPPSWTEYVQHQIAIAVYRIRGANSDMVLQDAAEAMALRDEFRKEAASMIQVRDDIGEAIKIRPANPGGALARVLAMLGAGAVPFLRPKPGDMRAPRSVPEAIRRLKS